VYPGPGKTYLRASDGKASVSSNGRVLSFGMENGWTMIAYEVSKGQYRFGWIEEKASPSDLAFDKVSTVTAREAIFADDPQGEVNRLAILKKGTSVTRLARMGIWAYIEAEADGVPARGFVLSDTLAYSDKAVQYADCLYPIRVNGKWGYMNYAGETVIAPQWASVGEFAYGVAWVSMTNSEIWYMNDYSYGLIDTKGNYILEPKYRIDQNGGFFRVCVPEEYSDLIAGYYDAVSGFFLTPAYDDIEYWDVTDSTPLILAEKDGEYGFLDRTTRKEVFPLQYDGLYDEVGYSEGYILAADEVHSEDGSVYPRFVLMDAKGNEVRFPEGIMASSSVCECIVRIEREAGEGESSQWGTLYGFARPDGSILVWPRYDYAEDFSDGFAAVYKDFKWGHIDAAGREIVPPIYGLDTGGALIGYSFHNGYAVLELADEWIILDTLGNVVFEHSWKDGNRYFRLEDWCALGSDLIWYSQRPEEAQEGTVRYGLMKADGSILTDALWEGYDLRDEEDGLTFSAEGLQAVKRNGLWGYIEATGACALTFGWNNARNFVNGLAFVEKDGKMAYIDHSGNIVWQEE
jgi:hypothetical protein